MEVVTDRCRTIGDVREELIERYESLRPGLEAKGLSLLFAARLPDAQPTGWKERLHRGDPQNNFGMHVHFGRVKDEFEAAAAYETYRRAAPEIMALTANSGVSGGAIVEAVSERQVLYRNLIPESVAVKPNMSKKEKDLLRKQLREIFGESSKHEESSQHSLEGAIEDLMIKKGIKKRKK